MSLPGYSEYKQSEFQWLGALPAHWPTIQLRHVAKCLDGCRVPLNAVERSERQGRVPYWGANCVVDHVDQALLDEPLVLLGEDGAPFFDRTKPVAFFSEGPIWPNNHIHVLRPEPNVVGRFLVHALNSTDYSAFIQGSTRDKLTQTAMAAIPVPLPSTADQMAVVAFLDRETAKIDALVEEQKRLIELLKEKRQAVISQAVTKGLDPNVPMKDSGVEWLGEVPAHWCIAPLGALATLIQTGPFGSQLHSEDYVEDQTPVINPSNIGEGVLEADISCTVDLEIVERLAQHKLELGDIVVGRRGEMGRCAVVKETSVGWLCGTGSLKVRLSSKTVPEFVATFIRTEYARERLKLESVGSTMDNLNAQILGRFMVPCPPADEQQAIVMFLSQELAGLDLLMGQVQNAVSLLQERRSALISAAVTGKIDVRGLAPQPHHVAA